MAESRKIRRRFAVFGGEQFYAAGGFHDFVLSANTLVEAIELATIGYGDDDDWWQIFDLQEWRVVAQSPFQAYGASDRIPDLDK